MATKKKGLGRGLDTLIGSPITPIADGSSDNADKSTTLAIELLRPGPYQPRSVFDQTAIEQLADSIKEHGIIQPIIVRAAENDRGSDYEIIAGERRWRASQAAGLLEVPVIIRDIEPQAALAIALIENIQREDLTAIEEARALERLQKDYMLTHEQIGTAIGRSRTAVSNLLRLLALDDSVQQAILEKKIDMGHARALLTCEKATQTELCRQVIARGMTVRETEALVKNYQPDVKSSKKAKKKKDPDISLIEEKLSEKLSTKVDIQSENNGSGRIIIKFNTLDVFDGIVQQLTDIEK